MGNVADPLRKWLEEHPTIQRHNPLLRSQITDVADIIDADHERRMEQCRRETKRAAMRYLNSVIVDYAKHDMKRDRKAMLEKYKRKGKTTP